MRITEQLGGRKLILERVSKLPAVKAKMLLTFKIQKSFQTKDNQSIIKVGTFDELIQKISEKVDETNIKIMHDIHKAAIMTQQWVKEDETRLTNNIQIIENLAWLDQFMRADEGKMERCIQEIKDQIDN